MWELFFRNKAVELLNVLIFIGKIIGIVGGTAFGVILVSMLVGVTTYAIIDHFDYQLADTILRSTTYNPNPYGTKVFLVSATLNGVIVAFVLFMILAVLYCICTPIIRWIHKNIELAKKGVVVPITFR